MLSQVRDLKRDLNATLTRLDATLTRLDVTLTRFDHGPTYCSRISKCQHGSKQACWQFQKVPTSKIYEHVNKRAGSWQFLKVPARKT